jgi:cytoskeletal protein RodZ
METQPATGIGSVLKKTRESRRLSFARVAEDTNIGPEYLAGLENDDYRVFPGEAYTIGFLRSYSEYLEIDPLPLIAEYKATRGAVPEPALHSVHAAKNAAEGAKRSSGVKFNPKIGNSGEVAASAPTGENEAHASLSHAMPADDSAGRGDAVPIPATGISRPSPSESLSRSARSRLAMYALLAFVAIAAIVAIFIVARGEDSGTGNSSTGKPGAPVEYKIEGPAFEKRIYPGDSILAAIDTDTYKLRLAGITDTVNVETPLGQLSLMLGEETHIDFNKDKIPELKLTVADFAKKESGSGALLRIEYVAQKSPDSASGSDMTAGPNDIQNAEPMAQKTGVLFRSGKGPYPFVATVTFRASCMFRYEADRRDWKERYYSKGETIVINADNSLVIWASNAQAAKITIMASGGKTADIELGAPGEVAVKRIGWSQSEGSWVMSAVEND